jgi:integrase/recombinase XerD
MARKIKGVANVLSAEEFKRLLKVISTTRHALRDRLLILLSFGLGLRAMEIAALKLNQVLDNDGKIIECIKLTKTKGDKPREIFIADERIKKAVLEYVDYRKVLAAKKRDVFGLYQPLILSQRNSHFSSASIRVLFKTIYKNSGINATSHSGRRQFATNLIEKGIDIKTLSTLMGHESIAETAKYINTNPETLKRVIVNALF